jgi:hypothetical protein
MMRNIRNKNSRWVTSEITSKAGKYTKADNVVLQGLIAADTRHKGLPVEAGKITTKLNQFVTLKI